MSSSDSINSNFNYKILPEDFVQYDLSFKIIVIGDNGVGKSCLIQKATKNFFEEKYNETIGVEFYTFNIKINDIILKLQIWDSCGLERYRSLMTNFYRNINLAIIVYSVTDLDSFNNVEIFLRDLRKQNTDIKIFLIGNKIDLISDKKINKEDGKAYAKKNKFNKFIEASAKNGVNSRQIFIDAAKLLYDDYILKTE